MRRGPLHALAGALVALSVLAAAPLPPATALVAADRASWRDVRLDVRTALVDGRRAAWAQVGPVDGPVLLLLNGTGSPMAEWDPALLAALAERGRRVLVTDYPGLGGSDPLPGRLTFDRLADATAGLLAAMGTGPVDVLGWSMGGFVAQRLLVRHPDLVRRAVLAGTNPGGPRAELGPRWVQRVDSDPDAGLGAYVRTNYPRAHRDRGWAFVRRVRAAQESGAYPPSRVPTRTYDAMVAAEDPWLASDANARALRSVDVPVLVTTGRGDRVTPLANSRRLARLLPDATLRVWPRAGHSFVFQRPHRVARAVAAFLR